MKLLRYAAFVDSPSRNFAHEHKSLDGLIGAAKRCSGCKRSPP